MIPDEELARRIFSGEELPPLDPPVDVHALWQAEINGGAPAVFLAPVDNDGQLGAATRHTSLADVLAHLFDGNKAGVLHEITGTTMTGPYRLGAEGSLDQGRTTGTPLRSISLRASGTAGTTTSHAATSTPRPSLRSASIASTGSTKAPPSSLRLAGISTCLTASTAAERSYA